LIPDLKLRVFDSVEKIGKESIDAISNDPFFTYGWFRTLETLPSYCASPIYVTVYAGNELVAFTPSYLELFEPSAVATIIPSFINKVGYKVRVLRCESPFCLRTKILTAKNIEEILVIDLLLGKIDAICREQRILLNYFSCVSQFDNALCEKLLTHRYLKRSSRTTFCLDIKWTSFDDYLASLKPKIKANVKREIKKCQENGVVIEESGLEVMSAKLPELYSNVSVKYKNISNIFDYYFFNSLNKHMRDKVHLCTAKKGGELIGFSLGLYHKEALDVMMVGFNYDFRTKTDFAYFNLCYYSPIQWAIEHGLKRLYYRNAAERVKVSRGCKREEMFSFVKYRNRLLNTAVANLSYSPGVSKGLRKMLNRLPHKN
jgi:uncharacterized protein